MSKCKYNTGVNNTFPRRDKMDENIDDYGDYPNDAIQFWEQYEQTQQDCSRDDSEYAWEDYECIDECFSDDDFQDYWEKT